MKETKAVLTFTSDTSEKDDGKLTFETTFDPPMTYGTIKDLEKQWENLPESHKLGIQALSHLRDMLKDIYGEDFLKEGIRLND